MGGLMTPVTVETEPPQPIKTNLWSERRMGAVATESYCGDCPRVSTHSEEKCMMETEKSACDAPRHLCFLLISNSLCRREHNWNTSLLSEQSIDMDWFQPGPFRCNLCITLYLVQKLCMALVFKTTWNGRQCTGEETCNMRSFNRGTMMWVRSSSLV